MLNLLESIWEYQLLLNKDRTLDIELDSAEQAQLVGLRRMLRGEYEGFSTPQRADHESDPIPVQLTVPGGFAAGEIRSVSANGMAIVTNHPPARDTRTILRVADSRRGWEYVFPGRVVWKNGRVIGVAFDGVPTRHPFLMPSDSWRPGRLHLGSATRRPLVA
jgi:hypothetical protein